jgi:hypothetical protein
MANVTSSWIFSISPGSLAIFLSSAYISADKLFSSASSAAFLAIFNSRAACKLANVPL